MSKGQETLSDAGTLNIVKLCRFELNDEPGGIRSGLYYEGRIYETDGKNAIGVHDPGSVRLHSPVGQPPSMRLYDVSKDSQGQEVWHYQYAHAGLIEGPASEHEIMDPLDGWDFEVRVAAILSDSGRNVEEREAPSFILGYSVLLLLTPPESDEERRIGFSTSASRDGGTSLGPFAVTPEELNDIVGKTPTEFRFPYEISVNEHTIVKGVYETPVSMSHLVISSSLIRPVLSGDVIAWPALPKPSLDLSPLGRGLLPTDRIQAKVEVLGPLVTRIA